MVGIAVLTPSLPDRGEMLAEAVESVRQQTLKPAVHAIGIDYEDIGIGRMLNRLAASVEVEWLARLDDDDLFKPNHLQVLVSGTEAADVIYSWCEVEPRSRNGSAPDPPRVLGPNGWEPNQPFDEAILRERNYIPVTTLVRRSFWQKLGGWTESGWGFGNAEPQSHPPEDWDFWLRALDAGARFLCIPEITWTYRYHGANLWFR